MQETKKERGKTLVIGIPLFLNAAIILTILVFATNKLRDHLQGLIRGYLDNRVRL